MSNGDDELKAFVFGVIFFTVIFFLAAIGWIDMRD